MPRSISVRVGSLSAPPVLGAGANDSAGLADSVTSTLVMSRAAGDAVGLADGVTADFISGTGGLGNVALGTAPLGV